MEAIELLLGKILNRCETTKDGDDQDQIVFETISGQKYVMQHDQDCCESVYIEDICGDLSNLVGDPILLAEEVSNDDPPPEGTSSDDSWTWTFYKIGTVKGTVTIRWFGTSNGYYSEEVNFKEI